MSCWRVHKQGYDKLSRNRAEPQPCSAATVMERFPVRGTGRSLTGADLKETS